MVPAPTAPPTTHPKESSVKLSRTYSRRTSTTASLQSTRNWRRQVLAATTAAFLTMYPVMPAWATAPAPAKASAPAPAATRCQINSAKGNIKHVVTIVFDNMHFQRDPARDGSTLVPSDLEQMPHLLNFIKNNGVLLSNHHTPLISHTSDDVITILTGVYPDRHGVATAANSYLEYKADGTIPAGPNQSGFTYWTDLSVDNTYNLISGAADENYPNGVNAPAPWVRLLRRTWRSRTPASISARSSELAHLRPPIKTPSPTMRVLPYTAPRTARSARPTMAASPTNYRGSQMPTARRHRPTRSPVPLPPTRGITPSSATYMSRNPSRLSGWAARCWTRME